MRKPIKTIHTIENATPKASHIYLYGDIVAEAWYDNDVSPQRVQEMLDKSADEVVVHISSFGGDVFAGIAIYNMLKDSGKKITTQIDSIGASSASIIAMAGEEIIFATGAQIMIHNPSTMCWGDKAEFEKVIASLDKCKQSIIDIYKTHGVEGANYSELMDAQTWAHADLAKTMFSGIVTKDEAGGKINNAVTRFVNRQQQFNQILTNQTKPQL